MLGKLLLRKKKTELNTLKHIFTRLVFYGIKVPPWYHTISIQSSLTIARPSALRKNRDRVHAGYCNRQYRSQGIEVAFGTTILSSGPWPLSYLASALS